MHKIYSVFANGGYYVRPFYISRIETPYGETEFEATPKVVCKDDYQQPMTTRPNGGWCRARR
ncbi:hypothetical protein O9993_20330 [Vibrio lentus]|nr:hypothetical protein [Vibrio lentus]